MYEPSRLEIIIAALTLLLAAAIGGRQWYIGEFSGKPRPVTIVRETQLVPAPKPLETTNDWPPIVVMRHGESASLTNAAALQQLANVNWREIDQGCGSLCTLGNVEHQFVGQYGVSIGSREMAVLAALSRPFGTDCGECRTLPRHHLSFVLMEHLGSEWIIKRTAIAAISFDEPIEAAALYQHIELEILGYRRFAIQLTGLTHHRDGHTRWLTLMEWVDRPLRDAADNEGPPLDDTLATALSVPVEEITQSESPDGTRTVQLDLQSDVQIQPNPAERPEIVVDTTGLRDGVRFEDRAVFAYANGNFTRVQLGTVTTRSAEFAINLGHCGRSH